MKIENIDKFGHCCVCHRNLIKNVVANGKVQGIFDADKDEIYMKSNKGSLLPISICKPCKESVDLENPIIHHKIMDAVQNGWALEIDYMDKNIDKFPEWNESKKKAVQDLYKGMHIIKYEKHHKVGAH